MMNRSAPQIYPPLTAFFLAVTTAAVALMLLVLIIPTDLFLAFSNYLQIIAALAGALVLLYLWQYTGRQKILLFAGAGFGFWGIANIGWYTLTFLGFRSQVFPSVIDIGLVLGLLLIAAGLWTSLPGQKFLPVIVILILVLSLSVPALMLGTAGFLLPAAAVTYCYFATCGLLIAGGLLCSTNGRRTILIAGTVLLGLVFMIYPLREIYLASNLLLLILGPVVAAAFALVVLGLLPSGKPAGKA